MGKQCQTLFFPWLCSIPRQTINITVIQVYAPTSKAEEAEVERFYEDLQDLLEVTPPKMCPFHYRGLECKSRKSRNTWSNRQIWPWNTEWSRAKPNRVLPRKCRSVLHCKFLLWRDGTREVIHSPNTMLLITSMTLPCYPSASQRTVPKMITDAWNPPPSPDF